MTRKLAITKSRAGRRLTAIALLMAYGAMFWISGSWQALAQTDTATPGIGIHKVQGATWRPEAGAPVFIAVLGSDTRVGPTNGGGGRCDAIHIVGINPQQKGGSVIDIPRDSYVNIPGHGRDKINAACVFGGAPLMVETLKALTGIPIHYYAITEFTHFEAFINELDGIDVVIPYDMADYPSGAFFRAGPRKMSGREALALARNRKGTPNGDFSRSFNQGLIIIHALEKFRAETADPHQVFRFIRVARRHTAINVPIQEMIRLGLLAKEVDPAGMSHLLVGGSVGFAGAASVVFIAPGDIFQRVADDAIY